MKKKTTLKANYVDGFVIPIKRKNLKDYQRMAKAAGKVWKEYGAIDYKECVGDDQNMKFGLPFPKLAKLKSGEITVFSWITYKSKAARDKINAKVMKDERLQNMMDPKNPPFEMKRMSYGGFKVMVDV